MDKKLANYILLMMKGFESCILENLTKVGTTVESLRFDDFSFHYFMISPLTEKFRVLSKVEELLVFIENLKAQLNESKKSQVLLAEIIVNQALN
ncbi:MAG: hypothetical protein ISR69_10840 [Gammaproteobacteria bacterium]|nr:hypothetical protein [Gammaproteobacteria bacterium]